MYVVLISHEFYGSCYLVNIGDDLDITKDRDLAKRFASHAEADRAAKEYEEISGFPCCTSQVY